MPDKKVCIKCGAEKDAEKDFGKCVSRKLSVKANFMKNNATFSELRAFANWVTVTYGA